MEITVVSTLPDAVNTPEAAATGCTREFQAAVRPPDREPDGRTRKYQPAAPITTRTKMTAITILGFLFLFILDFLSESNSNPR